MLGWGVPTFDSHYIFNYLLHTNGGSRGSWNPTGFSNADVDAMIVSLESETDLAVRDATIAKIWDIVQAEQVHLPIHNQVLNWGMSEGINFDVQPEDQPHFQFLTLTNVTPRALSRLSVRGAEQAAAALRKERSSPRDLRGADQHWRYALDHIAAPRPVRFRTVPGCLCFFHDFPLRRKPRR